MVEHMDRPPFRFAMQAIDAAGGRACHEAVREVEDQDYSTLFLADHYLRGDSQGAIELLT
jgi:hypothetical protein